MDHAYDKKWEHQSSSWSLKAASQHMICSILSPYLHHTTGGHINNYLVLERFYINKKFLFPSAVLNEDLLVVT